jgi:hypothetical protein
MPRWFSSISASSVLFPREPVAQHVRNGVDVEAVFDRAHRPKVPGALRVTRRRYVPPGTSPHTVAAAWLVMSMNGGSKGISEETAS